MKFKKNILVFGGSGLLGKCLIENYSTRSKLHLFLNKKKIQSDKVKIVNPRNYHLIENYIKKNNIDTILNLAGLTSIELCQKNKKIIKKV